MVLPRRGTICLVTDGARLAPGSDLNTRHDALVRQAHGAGAAGIDFIQIRERDLSARELLELTIDMIPAAGARTRVLVNDRVDIAIAAGAAGAHLRGESISPADARAIAPRPFVITRAAHSLAEVRTASIERATDLVIVGTIFPTRSKPNGHSITGLPILAEASRCGIPVLAIGGVDGDNVRDVAAAGATGIAAIGWFLTTDASRLSEAAATIRQAFDSTESVI